MKHDRKKLEALFSYFLSVYLWTRGSYFLQYFHLQKSNGKSQTLLSNGKFHTPNQNQKLQTCNSIVIAK